MQPAEESRPAAAPRVRTPLVLALALLTELVAIGVGANQWVVDHAARRPLGTSLPRLLETSVFTYAWRFRPRGGRDLGHFWLAGLLLDATVWVVSLLLIAVAVRGPGTFWRAFFGTWTAVIVATLLGAVVRGAVVDDQPAHPVGRGVNAMFGPYGPGAFAFWGGVLLGFLVALVVSIVTVATRRRPKPADEAEADDGGWPPPWYDQRYAQPQHGTPERFGLARQYDPEPQFSPPQYSPPPQYASPPQQFSPPQHFSSPEQFAPTQQFAPAAQPQTEHAPTQHFTPTAASPTEQQRTVDPPPAAWQAQAHSAEQLDQPTTRFPRPPDDEDMPDA